MKSFIIKVTFIVVMLSLILLGVLYFADLPVDLPTIAAGAIFVIVLMSLVWWIGPSIFSRQTDEDTIITYIFPVMGDTLEEQFANTAIIVFENQYIPYQQMEREQLIETVHQYFYTLLMNLTANLKETVFAQNSEEFVGKVVDIIIEKSQRPDTKVVEFANTAMIVFDERDTL